ncbi:alpha-ribazole phosphatase [Propionispira arboris]|uniref:Alpha-ribazole phosphatase n=1 Tax=Propionispira arboris TaxID=84035 RepID=A0A1H6XFV7_9FIRM|nr:alpha-ribazole phosphatase [Propionispira arboris]SEJ27983.1 alpha-ribazole phosphatase [Propionispira arboris]
MNIYVVRHGETEYNRRKVYFGWSDICLNETGRKQCITLKEELTYVKFDEIWASPSIRTMETAKIITRGQALKIEDRFRELNFGEWEGLHYLTIEKQYPVEWKAWGDDWQHYCLPGGESFMDFYERVKNAWNELKSQVVRQKEIKNVLLTVHGGTLKVITLLEKKLPLKAYWQIKFPLATYDIFKIE